MAALFGKAKSTINEHIKNIFTEGELAESEVMKKFGISEFQQKAPNYYNLDVIISVGYHVKSLQGTQFRIWAAKRLKEYIIKCFALNNERFKNGNSMNYFNELQERLREIRISERLFYQKDGINSLIQSAKSKARGFKTFKCFISGNRRLGFYKSERFLRTTNIK